MQIAKMTALVTGATGGIGQAIARDLAGRGASLVLTGRRADVLESLTVELGGRGIVADLSDRRAAALLLEESGPVDILVAAAGLPASGPLTDYSVRDIDRVLDVNLRVPVLMARLAADEMISRRRGHLVFVSSIAGKVTSGGASMYSATKFGLRGFSLALREDLKPHGVGVSAVYPGFIRDAGMYAETDVPLPRGVGTSRPGDVSRAVIRAIERNLAEVDVAPLPVRLGTKVAALAPGLGMRVQRMRGADRFMEQLAEAQRHKR